MLLYIILETGAQLGRYDPFVLLFKEDRTQLLKSRLLCKAALKESVLRINVVTGKT